LRLFDRFFNALTGKKIATGLVAVIICRMLLAHWEASHLEVYGAVRWLLVTIEGVGNSVLMSIGEIFVFVAVLRCRSWILGSWWFVNLAAINTVRFGHLWADYNNLKLQEALGEWGLWWVILLIVTAGSLTGNCLAADWMLESVAAREAAEAAEEAEEREALGLADKLPHACASCERRFTTKNGLSRHVSRRHPVAKRSMSIAS
jgi:hypothetical protein